MFFKSKSSLISFILTLLLIVGFTSSLWAATAEEKRLAQLIEGAKKEGKLVWYTIMGVSTNQIMANKFEEKYPFIKTEVTRLGAPRLLAKVLEETRAKRFYVDVISTQGFSFHVMKKRGLFEKYLSPQSSSYPKGALDPDGYGTSAYLNTKVVAYNTRLVSPSDLPKSYEDLLASKWKGGKMCVGTNLHEWYGNMLGILGRQKGLNLMINLSKQKPLVKTGNTLRATLLAAGEYLLTVPTNGDAVERLKAVGAPLEWLSLEPIIVQKHMAAPAANAPHPHAARLYIDFMLSKEGQKIIRDVGRIPSSPEIEPLVPRLVKGQKLYFSDHSLAEKYNEIDREFNDIFKRRRWKDEKW